MKVHLIGSLLCAGLLIVATSSGGYAASEKPSKAKTAVREFPSAGGPPPVSIKLEEVSSRKTRTTPTKKD
jgi:hypothetical protein